MMDDQNEVRRVNWTEVFSFTHIFKSFRMAIQPSKLALALAAIIVLVVSGGVMGWVWSVSGATVYPGEIQSHYQLSETAFDQQLEAFEENLPGRLVTQWQTIEPQSRLPQPLTLYKTTLRNVGAGGGHYFRALENALTEKFKEAKAPDADTQKKNLDEFTDTAEDNPSKAIDKIKAEFNEEVELIEEMLSQADKKAGELIDTDGNLSDDEAKREAREQLADDKAAARRALTLRKQNFHQQMLQLEGKNIFSAFIGYEWDCISKALRAVAHGNILTGMDTYRAAMADKGPTTADVQFALAPNATQTPAAENPPGFFVYILMAIHAVAWLWGTHKVFAILYLLIALATCSLFGGAIHRICAVHFAREEKISAGQALKFSIAKFPNFVTAPLIPLAVIFGLGALILLGGFLLGSWGGGILMGILLPVALILGMFIAFMAIGLIAGGPLMFPTIAVEGSDSFDAISRSFSYVFAKPWRSALYGLAALVYGVVTYLFVRVFVYITLCGTQWFARGGVGWGGDALGPDADKIDVIWAAPQFDALWGQFNWYAMGPMETIGAVLIGFWTFLLAAMVAAYLLSYVASSTTAIYYLLRRDVDSTDLDDVYVEEADEQEFPAPQAIPAEAPESTETPAEDEGGSEDASEQTEETSEQSDDEEGSDEKKDEGGEG